MEWFIPIAAASITTLLGVWLGFRLGKISKRDNDLREDQLQFIPMLNQMIKDAGNHSAPISVWNFHKTALEKSVWRFRLHLTGRRKRRFLKAWEKLNKTTEAELIGNSRNGVFGDNEEVELKKVQQILIARFNELLRSVENA